MSAIDLYNHLISFIETYTNDYGIVCTRSKYLERARFVLYRQNIYKPPPKMIIDKKDLPKWVLLDKYKDLLIRDATKTMFMNINKKVYDEVRFIINVEVG